ncbi:hypothetical protein [Pluralibacter gergoviae]|nr:hypothetical protein [Pluralibacter gergoviae]
MQLFLCEKPSQAKDIARVLGISKREQVLDVNYLGRYASTTLAAFELFLS